MLLDYNLDIHFSVDLMAYLEVNLELIYLEICFEESIILEINLLFIKFWKILKSYSK